MHSLCSRIKVNECHLDEPFRFTHLIISKRMLKLKSATAVSVPPSVTDTSSVRPSPLDIPEILERIISTVDRRSVLHLARCVCREWYCISRRFYCHSLVFCDAEFKPEDFENVLKLLPYAGSFHWRPPYPISDTEQQWLALRDVLEHIDMEKASHKASDRSRPISLLEPMRQPLRELCLLGAALTETVNALFPYLGSLTTLRLDHYGFHKLEVDVILRSCPQLESLFLKQVCLMAIDRDSTPLSSLDLAWVLMAHWCHRLATSSCDSRF